MATNAVYIALGNMVREYRGSMSQATVAALLSDHIGRQVTQATVSAHENGQRWGDNPDLIAAYADVLNVPAEVVQRIIGLPTVGDTREPVTFADIVNADPSLSDEAKEHLVRQYGLLQYATAHMRAQAKANRRRTS